MKQKFRKLTFVTVNDTSCYLCQQYGDDFTAIINGPYSQLYGGDRVNSYSLYVVVNDKIVNSIAWFDASVLTALPEQNREKAEEMIEEYNLSKCSNY